jgi:hypothetical protein
MNQKNTIKLNVAGVPCQLIIDDKSLFHYLNKNYWSEKTQKQPEVEIDILKNNNCFKIYSKLSKLKITVDMKKKDLLFKDIDWIIRTIIQSSLLKNKIFFIHSSSIINNGRVFAFLGLSGKGKSTIISNFKKSNIIGDDILLLRKIGNNYLPYQSPFEKMRVNKIKNLDKSVISKLFILEQGNKLEEKPIKSQKIISFLLSDNYVPRLPQVKLISYSDLILDLVKKLQFTKLVFPKVFTEKDFFNNHG